MHLLPAVVAILAGATATVALAADSPPSKWALYAGAAGRSKIASELLQARGLLAQRMSRAEVEVTLPNLRFTDGAVELDVRLWELTPELVERVRDLGFEILRAHYDAARLTVTGSLDGLDQLAVLPEVSAIHPRYAPRVRSGTVDNQADVSIGARAAREAFGVDGRGVPVGILSDSFHDRIGGQITGSDCTRTVSGSVPQGTGDLPAGVTVLDSGPGAGTDEGAAIAELIHDLAPGAGLLFHSVGIDEADFAAGVDELVRCGADVVVDDVIFLAEPMFQDGPVAEAMERAVAAGVPVFSAAGNDAELGVLQTFADTDPASEQGDLPSGIDFHDFGAGARFASIAIPAHCGVSLVLQWNEPYSGALGVGASTDVDLYLYAAPSASSAILAASVDSQGCSSQSGPTAGDPFEILTYVNATPQTRTVYMAVNHFCGRADLTFRIVTFGVNCGLPGNYVFEPSVFRSAQIYGHTAAEGVVAVAAIDYREIDSDGALSSPAGQIDVEPFSSLGGDIPVFFDGAGNPLPDGPQYRFKPDIAAPDGSNTSFFGYDIVGDADLFPNFFGTSAAAPHAAAVAALVRQANPALDPSDVRRILASTARDIEGPGTDPLAGDGALDALAALAAAGGSTVSPASPTVPPPTMRTASPTPTANAVASDCNADGSVTIAELIRAVAIALDAAPLADCPAADANGDGGVSVDELIDAVSTALE